MTLKAQLIVSLILIGLIPFLIMGISSYVTSSSAIEEEAIAKLEMTRELKKRHLETYLSQVEAVINVLGHQKETTELFAELVRMHKEHNVQATEDYHRVTRNAEYQQIIGHYEDGFKRVMDAYNLYDIYMICKPHGHVMYTASKASDLGANVGVGPLKNSGLGRIWRQGVLVLLAAF